MKMKNKRSNAKRKSSESDSLQQEETKHEVATFLLATQFKYPCLSSLHFQYILEHICFLRLYLEQESFGLGISYGNINPSMTTPLPYGTFEVCLFLISLFLVSNSISK